MTNNKLKIAAYTRVACDEENLKENNDGIIRQKTIIENYCNKHFSNYTIDFYTDIGCSGNTLRGRKDYPKLRDKLCHNEYDILIADSMSRMFRELNAETVSELIKIQNSKVRIVFIDLENGKFTTDDYLNIFAIYPIDTKTVMKRGGIDAKKFNRRST